MSLVTLYCFRDIRWRLLLGWKFVCIICLISRARIRYCGTEELVMFVLMSCMLLWRQSIVWRCFQFVRRILIIKNTSATIIYITWMVQACFVVFIYNLWTLFSDLQSYVFIAYLGLAIVTYPIMLFSYYANFTYDVSQCVYKEKRSFVNI